MNGYQYACRLGSEHCVVVSGAGILSVDTLTFIGNPGEQSFINVFPVPFRDILEISLPDNSNFKTIQIYDSRGKNVYSTVINNSIYNNKVSLNLSRLPEGTFFLELTGASNGNIEKEMKKIVKIN
jgi:hypothetical protein